MLIPMLITVLSNGTFVYNLALSDLLIEIGALSVITVLYCDELPCLVPPESYAQKIQTLR